MTLYQNVWQLAPDSTPTSTTTNKRISFSSTCFGIRLPGARIKIHMTLRAVILLTTPETSEGLQSTLTIAQRTVKLSLQELVGTSARTA